MDKQITKEVPELKKNELNILKICNSIINFAKKWDQEEKENQSCYDKKDFKWRKL